MDDNKQNPENPTPQVQQPIYPITQTNPKVIQPSVDFMQELNANDTKHNNDTQPSNATPTAESGSIHKPEDAQPTTLITPKHLQQIKKNSDENPQVLSFKDGYAVGSKIFWSLLLFGIVTNLIIFAILSLLPKNINVSILNISLIAGYVFMFSAVIYIIYKILRSNDIEGGIWLAIFGIATEVVVLAVCLIPILIVMVPLFFLARLGGNLGATAVSFILSFIVSYLFTKLSWGIAFFFFGKIKNKIIVKIIDIIFISGIVCLFAFYGLIIAQYSKTFRSGDTYTPLINSSNLDIPQNNKTLNVEKQYKNYVISLSDGVNIDLNADSLWSLSSSNNKLIREIDGVNYSVSFTVYEPTVNGSITLSLDPLLGGEYSSVSVVDNFSNTTGTYYIAKTKNNRVVLSSCKPDDGYGFMCSVRLKNKSNLLVSLNTYEKNTQSDLDIDFSKPSSKDAIQDFIYISKNLKIQDI